jgi:tagatose 1,6-diphosphate aldolase
MKLSEGKLKHMEALANDRGIIAAAAMDQRGAYRNRWPRLAASM